MMILALEQDAPGAAPEGYTSALPIDEARRVWDLQQEGIIREIYFRADRHAAVLLLECETVEQAQAYLDTLPLAQAGLITFDVIPLRAYPGFARLFANPAP